MKLNQNEIKLILDWVLELNNRIISIEEHKLIDRLIRNHIKIRKEVKIEEMSHEVKNMIKSLDKG